MIEVQVNATDFTTADAAEAQASKYSHAIGKLPSFLLADVATVYG